MTTSNLETAFVTEIMATQALTLLLHNMAIQLALADGGSPVTVRAVLARHLDDLRVTVNVDDFGIPVEKVDEIAAADQAAARFDALVTDILTSVEMAVRNNPEAVKPRPRQ